MRRYPSFTQAPERVTTFDSEGTVPETVVRRRYMQFSQAPNRAEELWSLGTPTDGSTGNRRRRVLMGASV